MSETHQTPHSEAYQTPYQMQHQTQHSEAQLLGQDLAAVTVDDLIPECKTRDYSPWRYIGCNKLEIILQCAKNYTPPSEQNGHGRYQSLCSEWRWGRSLAEDPTQPPAENLLQERIEQYVRLAMAHAHITESGNHSSWPSYPKSAQEVGPKVYGAIKGIEALRGRKN